MVTKIIFSRSGHSPQTVLLWNSLQLLSFYSASFRKELRNADKSHRRPTGIVVIITGDQASTGDAGRGGLFAFWRIKAGQGPVRIAYETVADSTRVCVGARHVSRLVDADGMGSQ